MTGKITLIATGVATGLATAVLLHVAAGSAEVRHDALRTAQPQPSPPAGGGVASVCGDPGSGDCFAANGTPFCDDTCAGAGCSGCCMAVCGVDPFCCDTDWDQICADEAVGLCSCTPADVPPNDDCANAVPVSEGVFAYTTLCASHDGPGAATVFDCDAKAGPVPGAGLEVWFDYTASFTATIRVHTCGQADYDTELVVYDGCACPAPDGNIIDCNDQGLFCPVGDTGSAVVIDAVTGNCYKIAVGGVFAFTGSGTVTIEPIAGPPCFWDLNADTTVGILDLLVLLAAWGPNPGHPADFNGDGTVGILDLLTLLANWGPCP